MDCLSTKDCTWRKDLGHSRQQIRTDRRSRQRLPSQCQILRHGHKVLQSSLDMAYLVSLLGKDSHLECRLPRSVVVPNAIGVVWLDGPEASRLVDQALWAVLAVPCRVLLAACPLRTSCSEVEGGEIEMPTLPDRCSDVVDLQRQSLQGCHSMDPSCCRLPRPLLPRRPRLRLLQTRRLRQILLPSRRG